VFFAQGTGAVEPGPPPWCDGGSRGTGSEIEVVTMGGGGCAPSRALEVQFWRALSVAGLAAMVGLAGPALLATTAAPATLALPGAPTCSDQWPMYQHDPSHHASPDCSAINPLTVGTLHPAWFFNTSQPVTATPTVSGGQVYVGDASGTFYDIDATTGKAKWTFSVTTPTYSCDYGKVTVARDQHSPSYGEITSSAAVTQVALPGAPNDDHTVLFGGGGTLFALDATTGACQWAVNMDPQNPASPMEVESSPVVLQRGQGAAEVIVGSDSNEGPTSSAPPGVQAFSATATSAQLLWKFEPENNTTVGTLWSAKDTNGCGDVWSSPALDPAALGNDGMVVATTGNCPQGSASPGIADSPATTCSSPLTPPQVEGIVGLDATTGCLAWRWSEPDNQYTNPTFPDGGDTDIGSSPILATIGPSSEKVVLDGSKSGYMYALDEASGTQVWANQPAQPGETGFFAGAIGGFIGSSALGSIGGAPTVYGSTAILAPFGGGGVEFSGGPGGGPSVNPDTSLICVEDNQPTVGTQRCDPLRLASLHGIDATTGAVRWQALVSLPSYASVTTTNGVVFAPATTGFSIVAYSGDTGTPLWAFPTAGAMSSGAAIVGSDVFVGAGTALQSGPGGTSLPPQANGVWDFALAGLPGT
jgi:polyvinyl alcohol dehydrogenase (cytochrome)